jgi:hypothetical protein
MDMFEPQDHPNVIPYPGAPPTRPYDNAGWTLAFQMGVQVDRILEPITGPFEKVADWNVKPPAGRVSPGAATGYSFSRDCNDAVIAVNRLLAAGDQVSYNTIATEEGGFLEHFIGKPPKFAGYYTVLAPSACPRPRREIVTSAVDIEACSRISARPT